MKSPDNQQKKSFLPYWFNPYFCNAMHLKKFYLLLLLAVALMLGHQLVPHCHCTETEAVSVSDDSHNQDFLSRIFGVDIGANHLENYTTGKITKYTNNPVIFLALFQNYQALLKPLNISHVVEHSVPFPDVLRGHITSFSLRPPPVV